MLSAVLLRRQSPYYSISLCSSWNLLSLALETETSDYGLKAVTCSTAAVCADWSDWTEAVCFIALTAGTHTQKICRLQLEAIQENLVKPPDVMLSLPVSKTEITATNLTACSFSSALNNNNNVITSAERRDQLLFLLFFLFRSYGKGPFVRTLNSAAHSWSSMCSD